MKGTPPFSRIPTRREFLSESSSGIGTSLRTASRKPLLSHKNFTFLKTENSVWLIARAGKGLKIAIRLTYEQNGAGEVTVSNRNGEILVRARTALGDHHTSVGLDAAEVVVINWRTTLIPRSKLRLEVRPRDVILLNQRLEPIEQGFVYTCQTGPTAGQAFVAAADSAVFYFQNLTTISAYAQLAGICLEDAVGTDWPELGMRLPAAKESISARKSVVLSDGQIRIHRGFNHSEGSAALTFIDDLYAAYLSMRPPQPEWHDWQQAATVTLASLTRSVHCTRKIRGATYFNAYVGSKDKPPESMVQAAVLVPLLEYQEWIGKELGLVARLVDALPHFFDADQGCVVRWLPGCKFHKPEPSEEESMGKMDSWYLLHTLMNLGRLAAMGRHPEMFTGSLAYAIRTAHHFNYDWPVFFNMRTLEVFKGETERGAGGEQDVPGLYVHVMMQAWMLTRDRIYLNEAETAAMKLRGLGFGILYQTNNTMFAAVGLAWLWKETGNFYYRDLSFVAIGSIMSHFWLWENIAVGRDWRTFMGLPPLHDAPYIAAYEEAEIYAGATAYLLALGNDAPAALTALLVEYGKRLLDRARFYFPSELPAESVCTSPKEGVIQGDLAIPVEDLYPSDEKAGQVGQEVYGAALAFVLATKSYHRWNGVPFRIWSNGLIFDSGFSGGGEPSGKLFFRVVGSDACDYDVRVLTTARKGSSLKLKISRSRGDDTDVTVKPVASTSGHQHFHLRGDDKVTILWSTLSRAKS